MTQRAPKRAVRLDRWLQERLETLAGKVALLVAVLLALVFGGAAVVHFALGHFRSYGGACWWAFLHLLEPASLREDNATDIRVVGVVLALAGKVALLVAVLLALVFGGAAVVHFALGHFRSYGGACWWAFLHLLEPASLREDNATDIRVVGVVLVLAGLIVLAGILFAILTEIVDSSLERLGESDVPVEARGHLLIAGWNDDLPDTLRFLIQLAPKLRADVAKVFSTVVVLAPVEARPQRAAMVNELRRTLRGAWRDPQIVYGDLDRPESYALGSAREARAIVVGFTRLSGHVPDPMMLDAANVRTALALASFLDDEAPPSARPAPYVGISLYWGEHADAAMPMLPAGFDGLIVDRTITSLVAIELTHPAWSEAIHRLLIHAAGASVQLVRDAALTGVAFADLPTRFAQAAPIGLADASGQGIRLAPPPATVVGPDDTVIVLAEEEARPRPAIPDVAAPAFPIAACHARIERVVLVVGFNHRVAALLAELADIPFAHFHVVSLSHIPQAERRRQIPHTVASRLTLDYIDGLPTDADALRAAIDSRRPQAVIVSGDWNFDGMERMEAEILFSFLALKRLVAERLPVLVMPYTGDYTDIFSRGITDRGLLSAHRLSGAGLAWTLLRPEVVPVFTELFGTHRTRLASLPLPPGAPVPFAALAGQLARQGAALAGLVGPDGTPCLAPPGDTLVAPGTELLLIIPVHQPAKTGDTADATGTPAEATTIA